MVVGQVHEGLAKAGQRVKVGLQQLRGLQSRDGRNIKAHWRRLVLLQLAVGLKDRRLRVESCLGKKTLVVELHLLPLLHGLAFLLLLLDYT